MHVPAIILLALGCQLLGLSHAAGAEMSEEMASQIEAIGPKVDPPATGRIFAPLQQQEPYPSVHVVRNEKYGPDPLNSLDVFTPDQSGQLRPILIFVHGGSFVGGDKRDQNGPFFDNVMLWAVHNGMIGFNMDYRLAPAHPWPAGAEDVAAAVNWVKANAARLGGDRTRVFVVGHSAGASHVAAFLAQMAQEGGPTVTGAVLISGAYEFASDTATPGQKAYLGGDMSLWKARSPLDGVARSTVPILVIRGEIDTPNAINQADRMRAALCSHIGCPTFVVLRRHSHMSEVYGLNTDGGQLGEHLMSFISATK